MKIIRQLNYYEVEPETEEDCGFIDLIESASEILVGGSTSTEIGKKYNISKIRIHNAIQSL